MCYHSKLDFLQEGWRNLAPEDAPNFPKLFKDICSLLWLLQNHRMVSLEGTLRIIWF